MPRNGGGGANTGRHARNGGFRSKHQLQQRDTYKLQHRQQDQRRKVQNRFLQKQARARSDQLWEASEARRDRIRQLKEEHREREQQRLFNQIYGHLMSPFWLNLNALGLQIAGFFDYVAVLLFLAMCAAIVCGAAYGFFILAEHIFQIMHDYLLPATLLIALSILVHSTWQHVAFARQRQRLSATQAQCAVCLDDFAGSGEECRTLVCGHKFHRMCVDPWLAQQRCCPLCRLRI